MTGGDILSRIVARRRERLRGTGPDDGPLQGLDRELYARGRLGGDQIRAFPGPLICEVKRRSPSRGDIKANLNPLEQAKTYFRKGASAVSVLTEQDHFGGALADIVSVRRALPDLPILRKDFLLEPEDVAVSWNLGADAVLLIAGVLSFDALARLMEEARRFGLAALVEVHTREEVEKIRPLAPALVGINCRDLRTFQVDLLRPAELMDYVDWPAKIVFESGIFTREDALVARESGCSSLLVGEAAVRDPHCIPALAAVMSKASSDRGARPVPFWRYCARRRAHRVVAAGPGRARPLVKICGITNGEDALLAQDLGADILGLVYAESPRRAPEGLAREMAGLLSVPLVGVVVEGPEPAGFGANPANARGLEQARKDLEEGALAAIQFHGQSSGENISSLAWPAFKAVRPSSPQDARHLLSRCAGPRVLVDAYDRHRSGGTGTAVSEEVLAAVCDLFGERFRGALWLAGGLSPDTVGAVIERWHPELIDASSRLEERVGKKSGQLLESFFRALETG
ncbi:indole-3-glycerol phosphate synthase [Alkalispirochaeta americana]|uniref:N-(5'-phosphoribosyl)anthranilate isomerase n=1 Tax=Alkalispirochaeta americana TaxID=159291 RepID=A0A1N6SC13_9SPIO|nr:bifunctional indole-3-glycerol phosphate synthase/phosphoribosylanthranilate isomerase [Alkalispirochaeta americana]SIQ38496.1 indole-3-glycerol phosphate synthase [Alkalispirochaeta americana]